MQRQSRVYLVALLAPLSSAANATELLGTPVAYEDFGASLATGDFDDDGYDDLIVGVPDDKSGSIFVGAVNVVYGTSSGLTSTDNYLWFQDSTGTTGATAQDGDWFGASVAVGDFDDDGFDDLAVGVSGEDVGAISNAGAVNIFYGSATGLTATGFQHLDQDTNSSSVDGSAEANDAFGANVAAGDFDNDGYDDLAVGVPSEDVGSESNAGAVNVFYGTSSGLTTAGDQIWDQGPLSGAAEAGDNFGAALAVGYFDNDNYADLAVGVPGEDVGAISGAGAVSVIYGTLTGLSASGDDLWDQGITDFEGTAEAGDGFGGALAAGDFDDDTLEDLAIGAPQEDVGSTVDAGFVNVLYGSLSGLSVAGDQGWDQSDAAGTVEADDEFGCSLASGDFDMDGYPDLIIGALAEDVGSVATAGAVSAMMGSSSGLGPTSAEYFHQDTSGVEGAAGIGDTFGRKVTSGDFDGDGWDDVAIGATLDTPSATAWAGAVNVLYGSGTGITTVDDAYFYQ